MILLESNKEETEEMLLFEILSHLNMASKFIVGEDRIKLAKLNLKASIKAKDSTSYQSALQYARNGIEFLPQNCWDCEYNLTFELYSQAGECECLSNNLEEAEEIYSLLMKNARNVLDKTSVYCLRATQYDLQVETYRQITLLREGLELFGIYLPLDPDSLKVQVQKVYNN
jgi:predicted ATPase